MCKISKSACMCNERERERESESVYVMRRRDKCMLNDAVYACICLCV